MAKIIRLTDALLKNPNDINALLKRASILKNSLSTLENEPTVKDLKTFFEAKISDILINQKLIDSSYFLCGIHISKVLADLAEKAPESWFAIDYLQKSEKEKNPLFLKEGGDACFLLCTLFKDRANFRAMRYNDYVKMGRGLYYQFYDLTRMEIGYYMSQRYVGMIDIVNQCIKTL